MPSANQSHITHNSIETEQLGQEIGAELKSNSIIALRGDLGSGKTTLVKGIVEGAIGMAPDNVNSPTFTYLNIYSHCKKNIYHFDLYRLRTADDFLALGFDEFFTAGGICCIEWSERILPLLPKETIAIELTWLDQTRRHILRTNL